MSAYTIDLTEIHEGTWRWRLYVMGGGTVRISEGVADTLEQASSLARTAMIVEHRKVPA